MFKILKIEQHEYEFEREDRDNSMDGRPWHSNPAVYICLKNENVMQNLMERHNRPFQNYERELLPKIREAIPELHSAAFHWDKKAGCSCGCSPGFVIRTNGAVFNKDVFIDIEYDFDQRDGRIARQLKNLLEEMEGKETEARRSADYLKSEQERIMKAVTTEKWQDLQGYLSATDIESLCTLSPTNMKEPINEN